MSTDDFTKFDDESLGDHFRALMLAYGDACSSYDRAKAARIHREFYLVEDEMRRRRGEPHWRRSGLENQPIDAVIARFIGAAQERARCKDAEEWERLYWVVAGIKNELQRRQGDARRELFRLYTHPDIDVRAAAAAATRNLAPLLSRHRRDHIDEEDWLPPSGGLDIERAGLEDIFPDRARSKNAEGD
jgi:hypothetical protein